MVEWWGGVCGSEGRIQYQHADAKMQMRGWMNAVYGMAARLCSVARQREKKRDTREVRSVVAKKAEVWTARGAAG